MFKYIMIGVILFHGSLCEAAMKSEDGTHVSKSIRMTQREMDTTVDKHIKDYIRAMLQKSFIELSQDLVKRAVDGANINLFPQLTLLTINQVAIYALDQDPIHEIAKEAYEESYEQARDDYLDGKNQQEIQGQIVSTIDGKVKPLAQDRLFRTVVEKTLEQSMIQQRRIMMQAAAQRQAQLMLIAQQRKAIAAQLQKKYVEEIIKSQFSN